MRKLANFTLWLGLFGLFLFFAGQSVGMVDLRMLCGSLGLLFFSWLALRRPPKRFEPSHRFRTLRRLGLIGGEHKEPDD